MSRELIREENDQCSLHQTLNHTCPCDRITLWVSGHQSIARLIITIIGLIVVLLVMPSYLRNIFWDGIKNHKILTSLLLIFGRS